jgi:hypothetical protein
LLSAEDIYRAFAEILIEEKNCRFASVVFKLFFAHDKVCDKVIDLL